MSKQKNEQKMDSYGWEKLYSAVLCLAGSGNQRERLTDAVSALHNSEILQNPKSHLPKEVIDEYIKFVRKMSSVEATGDEGIIRATVNTLDEIEMNRAAEKIIGFYDTVCRYMERD